MHIYALYIRACVCYGEIYSRYLCQLNRGLRGQVVFPWPSCSRGGFVPATCSGICLYDRFIHTHTSGRASVHDTGFGSIFKHTHKCVYILYMHIYIYMVVCGATPGGKWTIGAHTHDVRTQTGKLTFDTDPGSPCKR